MGERLMPGEEEMIPLYRDAFVRVNEWRKAHPQLRCHLEGYCSTMHLLVQASDVITLVNHVQQVSVQAVDSLADMLASSPLTTGSAAAALLVTLLLQRAQTYRAADRGTDDLAA